MSFFNWCKEDKVQKAQEVPKPKGLEIIVGDAPIEVKYDGKFIGLMIKDDGIHKFHTNSCCYDGYSSELLKTIAAKLDELNGVDANNP